MNTSEHPVTAHEHTFNPLVAGGAENSPFATHLGSTDAQGCDAAKRAARSRAKAYRDGLDGQSRAAASAAICQHIVELLPKLAGRVDRYGRRSRGIGLYSPLGSEVDTRPLQVTLTRRCYPFALPTVLSDPEEGPNALGFAMVDARTKLTVSPMGIAEPERNLAQDAGCHHRLLALFVPCLAFSGSGVRLGYGRGYYDRLLAHFAGHIIGLAFAGQQQDNLEAAPHDVSLHAVVTEHGLLVPPGSPIADLAGSAINH